MASAAIRDLESPLFRERPFIELPGSRSEARVTPPHEILCSQRRVECGFPLGSWWVESQNPCGGRGLGAVEKHASGAEALKSWR